MKRSRGRGRRPQQSHNRAFDSTGPDVKIRGTAAHVYEKYLQLARDANAAGDRVAAENYLQHAEHYYRILASAQPQQQQYQGQNRGPNQQQQYNGANGRGPNGSGDGMQPANSSDPSFSLAENRQSGSEPDEAAAAE